MKKRLLFVCLTTLLSSAPGWPQTSGQAALEFRVVRHGADATHLRALERLGVKATIAQDGGLRYVDTVRFLAAPTRDLGPGPVSEDGPTRLIATDFAALANQKVLDNAPALGRVAQALKDAGVDMVGARPFAFNSTLDLLEGTAKRTLKLDTTVSHGFTLGGIPLVGPGAKMRFALGPGGVLTSAHVATRKLELGQPIKLLTPEQLRQIEMERFGANAKLHSQIVYYAPPMEVRAQRIVPHRLYTGTVSFGGQAVSIRPAFIPLVVDAPRASLTVRAVGARLEATATVTGGRAPFQFAFSTPEAEARVAGSSATLTFVPEEREGRRETQVTVTVTDADGLVSVARASLPASFRLPERPIPRPTNPFELYLEHSALAMQPDSSRFNGHTIGLHAIGRSYVGNELGLTVPNASGFRDRARAASVPVAFYWREGLAFERDWKCPSFRGNADKWFDQVDLGFFTGHAGGGGWMYSSMADDGWMGTNEVRLGSRDAEWAVIAACGPLQDGSDRQNQGVFQGLHLLCGYASNSFDTDREGRVLGDLIFHKSSFLWWTIRDYQPIRTAWINTAIEIQPAEERPGVPIRVGVMGVQRTSDGVSSWDDRFHGFGPVSPDISSSTARTFWVLRTGT